MGRPSEFNEEISQLIIQRLMSESLAHICQDEGIPARQTVDGWILRDPHFAAECARSIQIRAQHVVERMEEIEEQTLAGTVDLGAARVVLSSMQWRASKMDKARFGDHAAITLPPSIRPGVKTEDLESLSTEEKRQFLVLALKAGVEL